MTREHTPWEELAAGHALRALEPEDEQRFRTHLAGCARCERTLADLGEVAAQLAYAAEPVEPPLALKRSILAAIDDGASRVALADGPVRDARQADRGRTGNVVPLRRRAPLGMVAAAAGLAALVALGGWNANLRSNVEIKDRAIARLERVEQLAADPGTVRVEMASEIGAAGTALIKGSSGVVLVKGLPANASDTIYVLWFQDAGGRFHAVDGFDVVDPGRVNVVEASFDRPVTDIQAVAISREKGRTLPRDPSFALVQGALRSA